MTLAQRRQFVFSKQFKIRCTGRRMDRQLPKWCTSNMGLYSFNGMYPTQAEALIAKNYCNAEELEKLNSIVSAYLEFAEMQARRRIPMYMNDWIETLDGFLKLSKHEILTGAGKISAAMAEKKAKEEYRKYKVALDYELSSVDRDCLKALEVEEMKLLNPENK